jgi:hypothetical protein
LYNIESAVFSLPKYSWRNLFTNTPLLVVHGSAIGGGSMPPAMAARFKGSCAHPTS